MESWMRVGVALMGYIKARRSCPILRKPTFPPYLQNEASFAQMQTASARRSTLLRAGRRIQYKRTSRPARESIIRMFVISPNRPQPQHAAHRPRQRPNGICLGRVDAAMQTLGSHSISTFWYHWPRLITSPAVHHPPSSSSSYPSLAHIEHALAPARKPRTRRRIPPRKHRSRRPSAATAAPGGAECTRAAPARAQGGPRPRARECRFRYWRGSWWRWRCGKQAGAGQLCGWAGSAGQSRVGSGRGSGRRIREAPRATGLQERRRPAGLGQIGFVDYLRTDAAAEGLANGFRIVGDYIAASATGKVCSDSSKQTLRVKPMALLAKAARSLRAAAPPEFERSCMRLLIVGSTNVCRSEAKQAQHSSSSETYCSCPQRFSIPQTMSPSSGALISNFASCADSFICRACSTRSAISLAVARRPVTK